MFVERFLTWVNSYILPAWKECMSIVLLFSISVQENAATIVSSQVMEAKQNLFSTKR